MKRIAFLIPFFVFCMTSPISASEPTLKEHQKIACLKKDLVKIRNQIEEAGQQNDSHACGLIKPLDADRLEIVRANEAQVERRINALSDNDGKPSLTQAASGTKQTPEDCLSINTSSRAMVPSSSSAELTWKVSFNNACDRPFHIHATLKISDNEEIKLDQDIETITVPANGMGKRSFKITLSVAPRRSLFFKTTRLPRESLLPD